MSDGRKCRERVMRTLTRSSVPLDIENIRLGSDLKNWESTKSILIEMVLQGQVHCKRTTKSWMFWVDKKEELSGGELDGKN